jgi:hypothetical protein
VTSAPSAERTLVVTAEGVDIDGDKDEDEDEDEDRGPGAGSGAEGPGTHARLTADGAVDVAPRVGMSTNFGGFTSPRFGVSVGYRPPLLDGSVRVVLAGSYYPVAHSATDGALAAETELHAVPLDLVVYLRLPLEAFGGFDWFEVEVGLGGNITVLNGAMSITGEPEGRPVSDTVGAALMAVALERRIGIGDLFVEAAYAIGTRSTGLIEHDVDGLTVVAGYRFYVF